MSTRLSMGKIDPTLELSTMVLRVEWLERVLLKSLAQHMSHSVKDMEPIKHRPCLKEMNNGKCGQVLTHGTLAPELTRL
jgi:hypothetical protein